MSIRLFAAFLFAFALQPVVAQHSPDLRKQEGVTYARDKVEGHFIQLIYANGRTKITNVQTGETEVVAGDFRLDDETYTALLDEKRRDWSGIGRKPEASLLAADVVSCPGSYNYTTSFTSPTCYFNTTGSVKGTFTLTSGITQTVPITLYRYRNWIWDVSYGTRTGTSMVGGNGFTAYWSIDMVANYYLKMGTGSKGYWIWGNYTLTK